MTFSLLDETFFFLSDGRTSVELQRCASAAALSVEACQSSISLRVSALCIFVVELLP